MVRRCEDAGLLHNHDNPDTKRSGEGDRFGAGESDRIG